MISDDYEPSSRSRARCYPPRAVRSFVLGAIAIALLFAPNTAAAQERRVFIHYHPTIRAQIAIWIESEDGSRFRTLALTERTALFGIGNRPGALQMNSAFRWPYGRREGVLPIWAHRRAAATGTTFPRVIFAGRLSEGNASSAGSPGEIANTPDESYCLSFRDGDEALDAMSCASLFNSNKGRYMSEADLTAGYAEPWEEPGGAAMMRGLSLRSLYPPRRDDAITCASASCPDHADVRRYGPDTLAAMPEIDAVSMPTPGDMDRFVEIELPEDWPDGVYRAYIEINTEGDHAAGWDPRVYPTPRQPSGRWDSWAIGYGYPYRGQPSVLYEVEFVVSAAGGEWVATRPIGYGDIHGEDGEVRAMDGTIVDDPANAPGSGADRLRADPSRGGARMRVVVPATDVCAQPEPPPECGRECRPDDGTCSGLTVCGIEGECVDRCELMRPPSSMTPQSAPYPERRHTHEWAILRFEVPESVNGIMQYSVRVSNSPIDPGDRLAFEQIREAKIADQEDVALVIDPFVVNDAGERVPRAPGSIVEVEIGHLMPETHYWIGVSAQDQCSDWGPIGVTEIETTQIRFTTVSPCFVATAAYGDPLEPRIGTLRRFRDRHLRSNAIGRALVSIYDTIGPPLADWIRGSEHRRAIARALLFWL